ncbi:monothiol glutaredoxin-S17-like [Prunus yedoensis var. nudiflora]|uniref:Monothiol glutaredoxin-S17-like n=1 Tax=Prunus yedoensis var. nudiflora TaxID=2094558 RepID=A0A315AIE6_PRUYE|nr:monothiol glutaredoxin-S17-like [Prunus yedoensis var. nudiflora]
MGGSVKDVQFKEPDSVVWPSWCEASKHIDEVEAKEQPEPFSVFDVPYSAFVKVADTSEGAYPSSLVNKIGRVARKPGEPAVAPPASLETIQELTKENESSQKENESSQEQIQAQDGLDDALKRRLQQLINSN